jgi:hypothetical protein
MRILALAALLLTVFQTAAFADDIALTDQGANPRTVVSGKILGAQGYAVDTYGINLALANGVRPRDVYEIRRHDKRIGEAMVVFVSNGYSLVTVTRGSEHLQKGDTVSFMRHAEMPREPVKFVPHEPVIVTARDTSCHSGIPGGGFSSSVSFGSTASYAPTTSYSSTVNFSSASGSFSSSIANFQSSSSFGPPTSFNASFPTSLSGFSTSTNYSSSTSFTPSFSFGR